MTLTMLGTGTQFTELTISGLANGAILALAALGFVVIFKATGVINFAQGQFLMLGAYLVHEFYSVRGWPPAVAVGGALIVAIFGALVIERLILRPLIGESVIAVIMVTIGLAGILQALALWVWGPVPARPPAFLPHGTARVLGANVGTYLILAIVVAAVVFAAFAVFFRWSKHGIAMRAVADDQQAAMVQGISVNRIFAFSWALAAATAVIGGMLLSPITHVGPEMAVFGIFVFPVVILGGLDSVPGTIIGGAVVGLLYQYTAGYIGEGLQQVVPFFLLILILLVKPYGLFGQVRIERV